MERSVPQIVILAAMCMASSTAGEGPMVCKFLTRYNNLVEDCTLYAQALKDSPKGSETYVRLYWEHKRISLKLEAFLKGCRNTAFKNAKRNYSHLQ